MYLHQQDIFKGSIFENISMCRQGISPEIIMETAETLGFEKFLINIHNGLDTLIDASGKKLPNTLVKKLLLLRAFVNKPKLLLLDEPWTGLEEQAKNNLIDYLLDKKLKRTILVATNDADFLSKCDIQIELNNGNAIVK
jgi:ABC-type bacteriocin/lantibiotic exporter with double-glycine peptidase domain